MERTRAAMIHLDANYLILGSIEGTPQSQDLRRWLTAGEETSASAIAWMEFVTGPVSPATVDAMRQMIEGRIYPVGEDEAELADQLFNATGRKRALRYDCLIAATAIQAEARLATSNTNDYRLFLQHGLSLA
jgi:predicted nucleic acid-binding protein